MTETLCELAKDHRAIEACRKDALRTYGADIEAYDSIVLTGESQETPGQDHEVVVGNRAIFPKAVRFNADAVVAIFGSKRESPNYYCIYTIGRGIYNGPYIINPNIVRCLGRIKNRG